MTRLRHISAISALVLTLGAPALAQTPLEPKNPVDQQQNPDERPPEERKREAEQNALRAKEEAANARRESNRLATEKAELSAALATLGPRIIERETVLSIARDRLNTLRFQVEEAQMRLDKTLIDLRRLMTAVQRAAREPTPSLVIHPERPVAAARSALLLRRLSRQLNETSAKARADLQTIAVSKQEAQQVEAEARAELGALRADEAAVRSLLARKRDAQQVASAAADDAAEQAKRFQNEARTLAELLKAIANAPPPRTRPSPLAPTGDVNRDAVAVADEPVKAAPPEQPPVKAGRTPSDRWLEPKRFKAPSPKPQFAKSMGEILRPVAGRLEQKSEGGHAKNGAGRGVHFVTAPFARVISPWDGVIRYAGPFPSYGHIVIIEPQKGYQLLLAGLADVNTDVNERVFAGEPLGRMGGPPPTSDEFLFEISATAEQRPERLYFEIRRRGDPIDAEPWLRPEIGKVTGL